MYIVRYISIYTFIYLYIDINKYIYIAVHIQNAKPKATTKNLYEQLHSRTLGIYQNEILKNIQGTYRKAGK